MKTPLFISVFLLFFTPSYCSIDSLINITQERQDTNAVLAGYELGKLLVGKNIDSSYMFLIEAAELADKLDYTNGKLVTYRSIGSVAPRIGKYEESLEWLNKGLTLIDSLGLPIKNRVDFLTNEGVAHFRMGFLGKAIETYIEAVDICRAHGFDEQRSRLLNNLGVFYRNLERYDEAIGIYEQAFELREKEGDILGMGNLVFNMAAVYNKKLDHESALNKLEKAESFYRAANSEDDLIHTIIAKGTAYVELEKSDEALTHFMLAMKSPYDRLVVPFNFNLYNGLAKVSLQKGKLNEAEEFLKKIEDEVIASDLAEQKMRFLDLKIKLKSELGEYKSAFLDISTLREMEKSIARNDKLEFRQDMETKYLTTEKEYEIELLNSKNELNEVKLKTARIRNLGLGIGLLSFSALLIWLFKLYQKTKHQKEVITVANKDKEVLLQEIHHRVKNNLQVISSLLSLQSRYVEDESAINALNEGQTRVESMALIHQNLYREDNITGVNMRTYIPLLADNIFNSYNIYGEQVEIDYDIDDLQLDVATVIPIGLVLNELISNALKYAFPDDRKGLLKVSLLDKKDSLLLSLSDNGIGINKEVKRTGFGTKLIHSFARKLEGELQISSENGTTVEILIKNYKVA